jgi:hypothetical protein
MSTESTVTSAGQSPTSGTRGHLERGERERLVQDVFVTVNRANAAELELAECQEDLEHCRQELEQVYGSISWRLTLPLRKASLYRRRLVDPGELFAAIVPFWVGVGSRHPGFRDFLLKVLDRFPSLKEKVRSLVEPAILSNWSAQETCYARTITLDKLPDPARQIYVELKIELAPGRQA